MGCNNSQSLEISNNTLEIGTGDKNSKPLETSDDNLETFSIFWLDPEVNQTEDNRNAQLKLREIINHLKTFNDQNECHQRILSLSPQDQLVEGVEGEG